jgi:hypothetical protein
MSRRLLLLALWLLLIFVTSSYFIDSDAWVRFVQGVIGKDAAGVFFREFWIDYGVFVVKAWHAAEYAILFILCASLLRRWMNRPLRAAVYDSLAFCALYAATDEWHQTFVPGRDGCVRDVIIDIAGAMIAAFFYVRFARRRIRDDHHAASGLVGKWTEKAITARPADPSPDP